MLCRYDGTRKHIFLNKKFAVHAPAGVPAATLLIIGQEDRAIVGKGLVKDKRKLELHGQCPATGKKTAKAIPNATLVELHGVGYIPQIAATKHIYEALLSFLR